MSDHYMPVSTLMAEDSFGQRIYELISALYEDTIEFFIALITSKGQLERVLETAQIWTAQEMAQLEHCLRRRGLTERKVLRNNQDPERILNEANVSANGEQRDNFKRKLHAALQLFDDYDVLKEKVEALRLERYDSANEEHEKKLIELWHLMMPNDTNVTRTGKHWRQIGFQGDDPATDFRGMGLLSLEQLLYFSREHHKNMNSILTLSHHPRIGFPLAVAGITMTSLTRHLLIIGRLKKHMYNYSQTHNIDMVAFHEAYCKIFCLFADYWKRANPDSVMAFNSVRMSFERSLADALHKDSIDLLTLELDSLV